MKTILFILGFAFVIGCAHDPGRDTAQDPVRSYESKRPDRYDLENRETFVPLDRRVRQSISCSEIQRKVLDDGRVQVIAWIRNLENRRIEIQVNCVFKDEQGFPTGDETPFQTLILTENAQESVQFVSMNERAKKFTIRARQAR